MLELSRRADNIDISNNCKGALWNMRDLLSNKNQYKHLGNCKVLFKVYRRNIPIRCGYSPFWHYLLPSLEINILGKQESRTPLKY